MSYHAIMPYHAVDRLLVMVLVLLRPILLFCLVLQGKGAKQGQDRLGGRSRVKPLEDSPYDYLAQVGSWCIAISATLLSQLLCVPFFAVLCALFPQQLLLC
jgi:hypothetical protein